MSKNTGSVYDEFTENFVKAILGISLEKMSEEKQKDVVKECMRILQDFMYGYLEENEGLDYAMYFKAAQNQEGIFDEKPEFREYCENAYEKFLEEIEISWNDSDYTGFHFNLANLKSYKPIL
jgi:predicted RNA-binding protein with EMAP domain